MPTLYPIVKDLTTVNHGGWGNTKEWLVIHFDGWLWVNGYRWGTYISYSGVRRYGAYGEIHGTNYMTW
jgi:hypothetical protein